MDLRIALTGPRGYVCVWSSWFFFFFFYCYGDPRDLHSFPTRRSSDLAKMVAAAARPLHPASAPRSVSEAWTGTPRWASSPAMNSRPARYAPVEQAISRTSAPGASAARILASMPADDASVSRSIICPESVNVPGLPWVRMAMCPTGAARETTEAISVSGSLKGDN